MAKQWVSQYGLESAKFHRASDRLYAYITRLLGREEEHEGLNEMVLLYGKVWEDRDHSIDQLNAMGEAMAQDQRASQNTISGLMGQLMGANAAKDELAGRLASKDTSGAAAAMKEDIQRLNSTIAEQLETIKGLQAEVVQLQLKAKDGAAASKALPPGYGNWALAGSAMAGSLGGYALSSLMGGPSSGAGKSKQVRRRRNSSVKRAPARKKAASGQRSKRRRVSARK